VKRRWICVLSTVVLAGCGFLKNNNEPTPTPNPTSPNIVSYTAVGASDAIGYGGSLPCIPFTDCPNGTGYVQTVARRFSVEGKTVTLLNLGVPGSVLGPSVEAIGNGLGRGIPGNFIEGELPFVSANATLVTVFAGGNDGNTIGAAIKAGLAGSDQNAYIQAQSTTFGSDMKKLVTGVKTKAPNARIVILNLPNLAGMPYAAGLSLTEKRVLQQIAVGFSAAINGTQAQGALVLDLMCDPGFYNPGIFSSDGFHPNDLGYARIADLVYNAAKSGTVTAPKTSCAQMTLF